jgi:hypothetical protein
MTARGPRVSKTTTRAVTVTTRATFTADELRKRLRLPADTKLIIEASEGHGMVDIGMGIKALVAEWTVTK